MVTDEQRLDVGLLLHTLILNLQAADEMQDSIDAVLADEECPKGIRYMLEETVKFGKRLKAYTDEETQRRRAAPNN